MEPDLRNLITVTSVGTGLARKVIVRHREFPEIRAEGVLARDAVFALLSVLRRSLDWTTDALHRAELDKAISDVESLLWVLECRDTSMIHRGEHATITKDDDMVCYSPHHPPSSSVVTANRVDDGTQYVEQPGDQSAANGTLVYSLGRRRSERRQPGKSEQAGTVLIERRQSDRRKAERREWKRLALIANIPKIPGQFPSDRTDWDDFPMEGVPLPNREPVGDVV